MASDPFAVTSTEVTAVVLRQPNGAEANSVKCRTVAYLRAGRAPIGQFVPFERQGTVPESSA